MRQNGAPDSDEALREARQSLSLLEATLEATTDGILVVDLGGRMVSYNRRFAEMWRIPDEVLEARDDDRALAFVTRQLSEPDIFLEKVRELYSTPEAESFDVFNFRDGRIFERLSRPQRLQGRPVGRVWSFRDVTDRYRSERLQRATYRISESAYEARSLEDLFRVLHGIVSELMPAPNFYIALHDRERDILSFPYFVDECDPPPAPRSTGRGLTEYVLRTGKPLLASPEVFEELLRKGEVEQIGTLSVDWLGAPLKTARGTFGVVVVQSYTEGIRFRDTDRDLLAFVSTNLAMAIERKGVEEAQRESEERYRSLVEGAPDAIMLHSDGKFVFANPAAARLFGAATPEQLIGQPVLERVHPEFRSAVKERIASLATGLSIPWLNEKLLRLDGSEIEVDVWASRVSLLGKEAIQVVARDISQQRRLEEQLRQSQKMQAIGQLAGGVAHDFNNLLTVISGNAELLLARMAPEDPLRANLVDIRHAGERAAALTRQLLAFSRKQMLEPKILDLNDVVAGTEKMLRRLIGEDISLTCVLAPDLHRVKIDPGQMQQVILNIAVNARDAMPKGGRLTIETRNVTEAVTPPADTGPVTPGPYVLLSIGDTGCGMTPEVRSRVFEPFFTTKGPGKGTGLGLATVYGIVRQSGGQIDVRSQPDAGTTIEILLPACEEERPARVRSDERLRAVPHGTETILLVEDEEAVRRIVKLVLAASGYKLLEASNGREALEVARNLGDAIHLVVTDVVMPEMSGRELAERLRHRAPLLRVLFISGYTDDDVMRHGVVENGEAFLQKPFSPLTLARKVREVLDAER